jgi:hypothetical protein
MGASGKEAFAVARETKIAHTVSIETIEYRQMRVWRETA